MWSGVVSWLLKGWRYLSACLRKIFHWGVVLLVGVILFFWCLTMSQNVDLMLCAVYGAWHGVVKHWEWHWNRISCCWLPWVSLMVGTLWTALGLTSCYDQVESRAGLWIPMGHCTAQMVQSMSKQGCCMGMTRAGLVASKGVCTGWMSCLCWQGYSWAQDISYLCALEASLVLEWSVFYHLVLKWSVSSSVAVAHLSDFQFSLLLWYSLSTLFEIF